jgi:hypothetical protein
MRNSGLLLGKQDSNITLARSAVLVLVSVLLCLVCFSLYQTEERDKQKSVAGSEMERARNRDTSNFDTVLKF